MYDGSLDGALRLRSHDGPSWQFPEITGRVQCRGVRWGCRPRTCVCHSTKQPARAGARGPRTASTASLLAALLAGRQAWGSTSGTRLTTCRPPAWVWRWRRAGGCTCWARRAASARRRWRSRATWTSIRSQGPTGAPRAAAPGPPGRRRAPGRPAAGLRPFLRAGCRSTCLTPAWRPTHCEPAWACTRRRKASRGRCAACCTAPAPSSGLCFQVRASGVRYGLPLGCRISCTRQPLPSSPLTSARWCEAASWAVAGPSPGNALKPMRSVLPCVFLLGSAVALRPSAQQLGAGLEESPALSALLRHAAPQLHLATRSPADRAEPASGAVDGPVAAYDRVPLLGASAAFTLDMGSQLLTLHSVQVGQAGEGRPPRQAGAPVPNHCTECLHVLPPCPLRMCQVVPVGGGSLRGGGRLWLSPAAEADSRAVRLDGEAEGLDGDLLARLYSPPVSGAQSCACGGPSGALAATGTRLCGVIITWPSLRS